MEKLLELMEGIIERQDLFAKQMESVLEKLCENQVSCRSAEDKFLACARSFGQVKEACGILLEAIDSHVGVITPQSWNDGWSP